MTILTLALLGAPAAAQTTPDSARIDDIARQAAQKFAEARLAGTTEVDGQTRPTTPPPPPGTRVELTLDSAVERALDRNLDLAVERLNPQTFDFSLAALNATYHPSFVSNFGLRSQTAFTRSQTAGGDILTTDTLTGNNGVTQNIRWGGGSYAVAFNNNRQEQSDLFATRNPVLNTSLTAAFSQPLLRNFRTDATRTQLQITKLNQEMSETELRATVVRTVAGVRNAYWDLVFAIQAEEVAQNSLALATKLVEDNRARVEVGTLAPLDVTQAEAEQAQRRQAVAQSRATRGTAELSLKRLIVNGTEDPYWSSTIEPVDRPTYSTEAVDVQTAVRRALTARTDLEQSRKQLQSNDVSIRSLSDAQLPSLDLTASYGVAGIGGTQFVRAPGAALGAPPERTIPSGFTDALGLLGDARAPTWNFFLNFSYPLGTSPAEAATARARVQRQQTLAQSRQLELQIATEVTNAALLVDTNRERMQAATVAKDLAQLRLEAEQSRFDVGLSTNFFVVQAQRDLRDAQNAELRALLDYRRAQVDFERVQEIPAANGVSITNIVPGGSTAPRANAGGGGNFGGGGGGGN
ncbi:MAG TPA: TolC family protein [Vicinamibacterales bacterium]|nr:TolC family protein [Vicinamibacterales bacterium]